MQALTDKRLFVLDYHDILMPYVSKVRKIEWTTLYGSRTLFFLNSDDTLEPLGIELTRPPIKGHSEQWKEVFTPGTNSTDVWIWRLAKAHVLSHDSCIHQLVIHWYVYSYLYTYIHACIYLLSNMIIVIQAESSLLYGAVCHRHT